jgi:PAS domain S-box-containing protein
LDISDHAAYAKTKILFILILGTFLLLSSFLILYFSYGALVENIITLNRSLSQKTEEWERTFNAMSDIVTIQDKNMLIVQANKAALDFFQERQDIIIGKKCFEVFRGTSTPCPGCPGFDTLHDAQNHTEIVKHEKLGKIFHVSSAPILDEKGEIQYLIHTAKDITDQKRLEEELFQAHKMEAIGTLAGGIAHDFNNILAAIIGYSEMAKLVLPADSKATKDINQVLKASERAADLVKQILTFSRKSPHHLQPFSPHLIIREALKMLRASLPTTIKPTPCMPWKMKKEF